MLVCSVVLRPERAAVGAAVAESADAVDAYSLGAIFATLTDDPGAASDTVSAFVGQFMAEAASATATVNALSGHPAAVLEAISAAVAAQDAAINVVASLVKRDGLAGSVMVNSDGTARQAIADGTMINL